MNRLFRLMLGFGIMVALLTLVTGLVLAQFPDPKDEAKLYGLAKKEGTVVWYGSSPLESMLMLAKDFEGKYPGIKVEVLRFTGVKGYQRFLQETNAKQYIADIPQINDYPSMKLLIQQGHIAEWKVPTSDRIPAAFRIGNYTYAPSLTDITIIYNINKVTPEEVKILDSSWKGVLDPRFKGRFTVCTNKSATIMAGVHMFMDPKYAKSFGVEFIKALAAQKPTIYAETVVMVDRVVAGEHDFSYWNWEQIANLKWEQGAPIRWLHPDPTPVTGISWYGISKYAQHPNAARLFLNWLTSEAGAWSIQDKGSPTILEGYKDIRKAPKEPWYDPIKTPYHVDWERWARDFNKDMDFWIKTMTESR